MVKKWIVLALIGSFGLIQSLSAVVHGHSFPSISFLENKGQVLGQHGLPDPEVLYSFSGPGENVSFTNHSLRYEFNRSAYDLTADTRLAFNLLNSNPSATIIPENPLRHTTNYLLPGGKEISGLRSYKKLTYKGLYEGVDMLVYGRDHDLKYDFVLEPGADPSLIRMKIEGAQSLELDLSGRLIIETPYGTIREEIPLCYQPGGKEIRGEFVLEGEIVGFELGEYDPELPLVIDPVREWSTHFGGPEDEFGYGGIAADDLGNSYMHGTIYRPAVGPVPANYDVFVVKFDAAGDTVWVTYFGGGGDDWAEGGIELDANGNLLMMGTTESQNFPVSGSAFQPTNGGAKDIYLMSLNNNGNRIWASYYGGLADELGIGGVAVDNQNNIILHGITQSPNFPVSSGALQSAPNGSQDAFVLKFNSLGQRLWATYLGGAQIEKSGNVAVDAAGDIYLLGFTNSANFPVTASASQPGIAGGLDMYVIKLNTVGDTLWGTFLGGTSNDYGIGGIDINENGVVYLQGFTLSNDFPASASGVYQSNYGGAGDGCLAALDPSGNLIWASFLGGFAKDVGNHGLKVDPDGNLLVAGYTESNNLILTPFAYQTTNQGNGDFYLARFSSDGNAIWTSYYGGTDTEIRDSLRAGHGLATNADADMFIFGCTESTDFASSGTAYQVLSGGKSDAILMRFAFLRLSVQGFGPLCNGDSNGVAFATASGISGSHIYIWNTGDNTQGISGLGPGNYVVIAVASNGETMTDSVTLVNSSAMFNSSTQTDATCPGLGSGSIDVTVGGGIPPYLFTWSSGHITEDLSNITAGTYTLLITDDNFCSLRDTFVIGSGPGPTVTVDSTGPLTFCEGQNVELEAFDSSFFAYEWSTGATSSNLNISTSGNYSVIITDSLGCKDTSATFLVTVILAPAPQLAQDTAVCEGDSVFLDARPGFMSYLWSDGDTSQTNYGLAGQGMWVEVSDANGCSARDTILIGQHPYPVVDLGPDTLMCEGDFILLDAGPGYGDYLWSNGANVQTQRVEVRGRYWVEVTTTHGCKTRSSFINVFFIPNPPQPVIEFDDGMMVTNNPGAYTNWQWVLNNQNYTTDSAFVPFDGGTYVVTVDQGTKCTATSDPFHFSRELSDLDIPQGFSPNGDGVNDNWKINNIEFFKDNTLAVINRWGTEVYKVEGYENEWTGESKQGKQLPDGTYFYVLDLKNGQPPLTGYIIINR